MNRPNFIPIFTEKSDFCEESVSKPVETFIPKQAISISELVQRFERGQRLNVHANFAPGSNFDNIDDDTALARIKSENIDSDDFPPTNVYDIADVEAHYLAHQEHKQEFSTRLRKKAEDSKQVKPKQTSEEPPANPPKNSDTDS